MLFRHVVLQGIEEGRITLAFRRWKRAAVKSGGSLHTSAGVVRFGGVSTVNEEDLSEREAHAAGYADRRSALRELGGAETGTLYRIEIAGLEPDERISLRQKTDLSGPEWERLRDRFERWDKEAPGYFPAILRTISDKPGIAASALASGLGVEKPRFKQDVRKLKELGLTESLETGYRLSPRGEAVREKLDSPQ